MALTPSEWFDKLNALFTAATTPDWQDKASRPKDPQPRNEKLDLLWSYYVGDPPLPEISEEYEDIFRDVMRKARCNYAPMCVSAMLNRMELSAISTDLDSSPNGDDKAAEIMEDSGFAAQFKDLLGYMFAMGEAYAMVVPNVDGPTIHAIDPRRCIGIPDRNNPVRLRAVLIKDFDPIEDVQIAHLFLPGQRWELRYEDEKWKRVSDTPEAVKGLEKLGGIPIVRFENPHGLGEYEPHLDVLDRIIDTTLQRIVLSKFQAFKQRGVSGDEDEEDEFDTEQDSDGELTATERAGARRNKDWDKVFRADPGAVWKVPAGWDFWESGQADMSGMLQAKRDDTKEFAAVTFTPLYLITPDDANGSAAGADLLREGLTSKVRDRRARVTPGLKLVWRIVFAMAGETARGAKLRLHWGPIEFRSLAEKGSATAQASKVLSRRRILSEVWEMSPQDIEDNEVELSAERLIDAAQLSGVDDLPTDEPDDASAQVSPVVEPAAA
nr:phage portal protein [Mycobacterium sp. UM_NZ2]